MLATSLTVQLRKRTVHKMYYDSIGELSRRIHEQTVSPVEVVDGLLETNRDVESHTERVHHCDGR